MTIIPRFVRGHFYYKYRRLHFGRRIKPCVTEYRSSSVDVSARNQEILDSPLRQKHGKFQGIGQGWPGRQSHMLLGISRIHPVERRCYWGHHPCQYGVQ
ncbi:hypothetical protein TNCV_2448411 [Trichonephila clavipes]|uniref:Uncharacterized protein n=1 Tax=Trichonephila clavipes TaxID=2585209 RepID=A0A8X6VN01_TRICX|nr:hypothetical protein TNCV_2448411 [Trichonephila clavipes]